MVIVIIWNCIIILIKIFNTISHLGPALCLLVIVIFATNEKPHMNLTLGMFILGVAMMGAAYSGFLTNTQDIAPNFAGTQFFIILLGARKALYRSLYFISRNPLKPKSKPCLSNPTIQTHHSYPNIPSPRVIKYVGNGGGNSPQDSCPPPSRTSYVLHIKLLVPPNIQKISACFVHIYILILDFVHN